MNFQHRSHQKSSLGNRRTQYILLILAVIIIALVIVNQQRKKQKEQLTEATEPVSTTKSAEPVVTPTPQAPAPTETTAPVASTPAPAQPVAVQAPAEPNQIVVSDGTSPEATAIIRQAVLDKNEGRIIPARDQFNRALDMKLSDAVRDEVKKQLTQLAQKWLFEKTIYPGDTLTELHKVQSGEVLAITARQYKVPHECVEKINGIINPERLQAGQVIKVVNGPFSVVISKKNYTLDLYLQGMFVKTYKVGLGKVERETPSGKWRASIGGKMVRPTWTDPDTGRVYHGNDPDYPLGSRWIALEGLEGAAKGRTGFAIHGTKDPETIGTRASRGCIRLFNGDVVEVYDMMEPGVSEVLVVE
jgi:lipoprotein-anchoring transpeptidase ErfK/SrfK